MYITSMRQKYYHTYFDGSFIIIILTKKTPTICIPSVSIDLSSRRMATTQARWPGGRTWRTALGWCRVLRDNEGHRDLQVTCVEPVEGKWQPQKLLVRWGLSSSSRSEAVWAWNQDSMWCQFVEELRFVSASRPPPRLRQQHQQLLTKFHFHITPVMHLPLFSILRLSTPKPNPNVILCAHRVSILSITNFSLHIHLCQPDRVRWG